MRYRTGLALIASGLVAMMWKCRSGPRGSDIHQWRWRPAAAMTQPRVGFGLVTLRDGRVLACGGADREHEPPASCEIYDPRTDRWSPAAAIDHPRGAMLMVRLADGRVLEVGGAAHAPDDMTQAGIYDPTLDRWTPIHGVPRSATGATLTALPAGGAILVGGSYHGNDVFADSFVLDPSTGTWTAGPQLGVGREAHCAAWTDEGVIVAGGRGQYEPCWPSRWLCWRGGRSPPLASVERWKPGDARWRRGRASRAPLPYCRGISLADRTLLAATDERSARYDSSRDRWRAIAAPARSLSGRTFAALPGGGAIAAGGYVHPEAPSQFASLILAADGDAWQWGPPLQRRRTSAAATTLADGRVMLAGGRDDHGVTASVEIFGP